MDVAFDANSSRYTYINLNENSGMVIVEKTAATIYIACHPMRLCIILRLLLLSTIQYPRHNDITLSTLMMSNGKMVALTACVFHLCDVSVTKVQFLQYAVV